MCPVLDDPELEEGPVLEIGRRLGDVPGSRAGGSGEGGVS